MTLLFNASIVSNAAVGDVSWIPRTATFYDVYDTSTVFKNGSNYYSLVTHHVKQQYYFSFDLGDARLSESGTYLINMSSTLNITPGSNSSSASNLSVNNEVIEVSLLCNGTEYALDYGTQGWYYSDVFPGGGYNYLFLLVKYEADLTYWMDDYYADKGVVKNSISMSGTMTLNSFNASLISTGNTLIQKIDNVQDGVDNMQNLQEVENNLQEESNEIQKGILGQITDFFGSFFENIINAVKSLFIPEDGYFADFFTRLNDFFSEKLGVLYAPIDIFIDILNGILGASGVDAGIYFPGISWDGVWIVEPQTISLGTYAKEFPDLQEKIYFVTDIIMVGSVLLLLQNKLKEVMTN